MPYKDSDLITLECSQECMDFGVETHLGDGVMSTFVFPLTAIAQEPHFDFHWQYNSHERPMKALTTLP